MSLLGPLLFNIFMKDLTFAIRDCRLISYADDTKLHLSHQDSQAVEDGINLDLTNTIQWFQQNGMIANPDKYQALVLGNTAHDFDIKCEEKSIPQMKPCCLAVMSANFYCVEKPENFSGLQRDLNPRPRDTGAML